MKKILILIALLWKAGLEGQTPGEGAATAAQTAEDSSWQNWVFAGCSIVIAAAAIIVVSLSTGQSSDAH